MSLLSFMGSVIQVAMSQEDQFSEADYMYPDYGSGDLSGNSTPNCTFSNASTNCTDLPANELCLNCTFNMNCMYGKNTTVECTVLGGVECMVSYLSLQRNGTVHVYALVQSSFLIHAHNVASLFKQPPSKMEKIVLFSSFEGATN